jgi:hypothetical protein
MVFYKEKFGDIKAYVFFWKTKIEYAEKNTSLR